MKKTLLLLGLLLLGLPPIVQAQQPKENKGVAKNFLWYKLIQAEPEKELLQIPQQVVASKDGNIFATHLFHSKKRGDIASIFNYDATDDKEKSFAYGDDGEAANGNTNFSFYKLDPSGNLIWHIYTCRGDFSSNRNTLVATPDGGFIVALDARDAKSKSKTERNILRFIQSDGKPYEVPIKSLYVGADADPDAKPEHRGYITALVKVSKEGMIQFVKQIETSHEAMPDAEHYSYGTNEGIQINATAVDEEGNIYLGGKLFTSVSFGDKTYKAKNIVGWNGDPQKTVGDFIIIKFNAKGNFLSCYMEEGKPIGSSEIREMVYKDGKLYWAGGFVGTKNKTAISLLGKSIVADMKKSMVFGCIDTKTFLSDWISQLDVKKIAGNRMSLIFVDGLTVGLDKVYIAGRCAGALHYADGKEYLQQPLQQHRGYVLALDKNNGTPLEKKYAFLPEVGISNAVDVSLAGRKVIVSGYNLGQKAFYRVLDMNLSEHYSDYHYVDKAMVNFGGDVVRNMFIGNARARNSGADILTPTGYKHIEKNKFWMGIIVAHKLPFPFLSTDKQSLNLVESKTKLEVFSSCLTSPIKVTITGEGFKSDLQELSTEGGFLNISFDGKETETPEKRKGKLTLSSGDESYEVLLSAMTKGKMAITPSIQTLDFATLPAGQTKSLDLGLQFKNITTPILCSIGGDQAKYFSLDKDKIEDTSKSAKLVVTFKPTKDVIDYTDAYITLKADSYEVRVPLLGKAIYTLGVSSKTINFGKVNQGESKSEKLTLAPRGIDPNEMISIEVTEGKEYFSIDKSSISTTEDATLTITFTPTATIKATRGKLLVKCGDLEEVVTLEGSNATSNDAISINALSVITREGTLFIRSSKEGFVRIYTLDGKLMIQEFLDSEKRFNLLQGSYILFFEGETHKVIIQ